MVQARGVGCPYFAGRQNMIERIGFVFNANDLVMDNFTTAGVLDISDGYMVLSGTEDYGIRLTGTMTTGIDIPASASMTTGISIAETCTDAILLSAVNVDGIHISGNNSNYALNISGANTTAAIIVSAGTSIGLSITTALADGIKITSANTDAIELSGANTYGVNISGANTGAALLVAAGTAIGLSITTAMADAIKITSANTDAIELSGNNTYGLNISGANTTAAILINAGTKIGLAIATTAQTDGILISGACVDGIHISGICSATGINITGTTMARAIMIGAFGETSNLILTTARNYPLGVFAKVATSEDTTAELRCAYFRLRVNTDIDVGSSANWGSGLSAVQSQIKFYGGANDTSIYCWHAAGLWAHIETDGADSVLFEDGCVAAALFAHVGLLASSSNYTTIKTGAVACGVAINSGSATNVTATGDYAGLYIYKDVSGSKNFESGILIATGCDIGVDIVGGTTATGPAVRVGTTTTGWQVDGSPYYAMEVCADVPTGAQTISGNEGTFMARLTVADDCVMTSNVFQTVSYNRFEIAGAATMQGWNVSVFGYFKTATSDAVGANAACNASIVGMMNLQSGYVDQAGSTHCFMAVTYGSSTDGNITDYSGFCVFDHAQDNFDNGFFCTDSAATIGLKVGNCTTGISLDGDMTDGIKIVSGNTITDGIDIAACTNGINLTGDITGVAINYGLDGTTYTCPKFLKVGDWDDWTHWDQQDEFIEVLVETTATSGEKPMIRHRLAGHAATSHSGVLTCMQLQTYNQAAVHVKNMTTLDIQSGFKGAATLTTGGKFVGIKVCLEDMSNQVALDGDIYCLELKTQWYHGSTAFGGENSFIFINPNTGLNMNSVMRIDNGAPTYLIDFDDAVLPFNTGSLRDSNGSTDIECDAYIQCVVGSTPYYIPLYDTKV